MSTTTATYQLEGMTCQHCVSAVRDEIGRIAGVTDITVHLASGAVTIFSEQPVDREQVRAAVDEAGYELVG